MKKTKLSVITCVYNTSVNMLKNCLLSIKNSLVQDLEVIVVDDGSTTDYSTLKTEFSNFTWYKTENQGTLKAREFGAKKATGDLIYFIDADDEVTFDYFDGFLQKFNETNADIVINDWAFWTEKARYYCGKDSTICNDFTCKNEEVLAKYFAPSGYEHAYFVVWNKVFRKDVILSAFDKIEAYNLNKFIFSEDVLMTYFAFTLAKSVTNTHSGFYFYRIHDEQQINASTDKKLENQITSNAKTFEIIENDLKKTNRFDEFEHNLRAWQELIACNFYATAKNSGNPQLAPLIQKLYNQPKLKKMPAKADYFYGNHKLLPTNFYDIEKNLKEICNNGKKNLVFCRKRSYTYRHLLQLKHNLKLNITITNKKTRETIHLIKERYSIKQKIIHNNIVFFIGIKLFPKGSKIRKFLKVKL